MVPSKFFQQLLKDLGDPQPHSEILKSSARKITYRLFDLKIFRDALNKQNTLAVKDQVLWSGDLKVSANSMTVDPREALAAAKSRAHGQGPRDRITCQSNFVVGLGEGRATRELDVIWWPNLYNTVALGKLGIRLYVNRVELI